MTEDSGVYRGDLMCSVRSLHYDFARRVGALVLGPHSCTDQTGAVTLFERIDPLVRRVETIGDPADYSTTYVRTATGWRATPREVETCAR